MLNAIKYVKMLQNEGFTKEQAETTIQILVEVMESKLATREDMQIFTSSLRAEFEAFRFEIRTDFETFRSEMRAEFEAFRSEMRAEMKTFQFGIKKEFTEFRSEIRSDLQSLELRLTIRIAVIMAASITVLTAIQKLL